MARRFGFDLSQLHSMGDCLFSRLDKLKDPIGDLVIGVLVFLGVVGVLSFALLWDGFDGQWLLGDLLWWHHGIFSSTHKRWAPTVDVKPKGNNKQ